MSISLNFQQIRDAGDLDSADYPDSELTFERDYAEGLVNDHLSPPSSNNTAYVQTAALLAAALATETREITQANLGDASISFESGESLSLLERAYARDPTNQLQEIMEPDADEPFVFTA